MQKNYYPRDFIEKYAPDYFGKLSLPTIHDIELRDTNEYGKGIFAVRAFKRGELISDFIAEPADELLQHTLQRGPRDNLYDPYFIGFLLHSCNPNVVLDMHQQKVFCIRDIHMGDPLFMDYASTEDQLFNQFPCGCNAPNCRFWITGRNELVNAHGEAHLRTISGPTLELVQS